MLSQLNLCSSYSVRAGYERFLNPLDGTEASALDPNNEKANEYFSYIIHCLEGEISRKITPGELQDILIELHAENIICEMDMLEIPNMNLHEGLLELFTIMPGGTPHWPLKFFYALERAKPGFSRKIDPCEESPGKLVLSVCMCGCACESVFDCLSVCFSCCHLY